MLPLSFFHDEIVPRVPGCPIGLVDKAIRDAFIEFCEKTRAHQTTLTGLDIIGGIPQVSALLTDPVVIYDIRYAFLDEQQELTPAGPDMLVEEYGRAWELMTGTPRFITLEDQSTLRVAPYPEAAMLGALTVRVALRPTYNAAEVVDSVATKYKFQIGRGALAQLMSAPESYSYSNHGLAAVHRQTFLDAIDRCIVSTHRGNTRQPIRVRARFF